MYDIHEISPARLLGEADSLAEALDQIDDECRRIHAAAAETGDLTAHRFEVCKDGTVLSWLMYEPDPALPYQSVNLDGLVSQEAP